MALLEIADEFKESYRNFRRQDGYEYQKERDCDGSRCGFYNGPHRDGSSATSQYCISLCG